jgi:hypothetical protein
MRALFGIASLLVVLAIVGILAMKQMKAVNGSVGSAAATVPSGASPAPTSGAGGGDVREQSLQLQRRVKEDVAKSLQQGAARSEDAQK